MLFCHGNLIKQKCAFFFRVVEHVPMRCIDVAGDPLAAIKSVVQNTWWDGMKWKMIKKLLALIKAKLALFIWSLKCYFGTLKKGAKRHSEFQKWRDIKEFIGLICHVNLIYVSAILFVNSTWMFCVCKKYVDRCIVGEQKTHIAKHVSSRIVSSKS